MRSLMVRLFLVAVSLLALAAARLRAEVKVSGALKVPTHDLVQLQAEGTAPGAVYFWSITPRLRPSQVKRGKGSIIFTAAPGVYTVGLRAVWIKDMATGELDGEEVEVEVVIGDKVPPLPDPKPFPPVPVPPSDPLVKALQDAYATDTEADKAAHKTNLAALYRQGATIAYRAELTTWGALFDVMSEAAKTLGVGGKIKQTQLALQMHLKSKLPTARGKTLDGESRKLAAETFAKIGDSLEAVK